MALTETTTYPHYIRANATPEGILPMLSGRRFEDNEHDEHEHTGTRDDPFLIQTFDAETTRILRGYLAAMGTYWNPVTD